MEQGPDALDGGDEGCFGADVDDLGVLAAGVGGGDGRAQ